MTQTATALEETAWDLETESGDRAGNDSVLDFHDLSLIQDKLKLTPTERFRAAEAFAQTVYRLRNAKPA